MKAICDGTDTRKERVESGAWTALTLPQHPFGTSLDSPPAQIRRFSSSSVWMIQNCCQTTCVFCCSCFDCLTSKCVNKKRTVWMWSFDCSCPRQCDKWEATNHRPVTFRRRTSNSGNIQISIKVQQTCCIIYMASPSPSFLVLWVILSYLIHSVVCLICFRSFGEFFQLKLKVAAWLDKIKKTEETDGFRKGTYSVTLC